MSGKLKSADVSKREKDLAHALGAEGRPVESPEDAADRIVRNLMARVDMSHADKKPRK